MRPERFKQVRDLAGAALDLPEPERPAFLARSCAGDETLRAESPYRLELAGKKPLEGEHAAKPQRLEQAIAKGDEALAALERRP